jgi:hypothetical protein
VQKGLKTFIEYNSSKKLIMADSFLSAIALQHGKNLLDIPPQNS